MNSSQPNPTTQPAVTLDYSSIRHRRRILYQRFLLALVVIVGLVLSESFVLPFFNRRRDESPRVKCASNMKQIGLAAIMYADNEGGRFPDDLGTLFQTQDLIPNVFVCPSTATQPPAGPTTQAVVDQLKKAGSSDYLYVGKGLTLKSSDDAVLLYEPLSDHGDGMNVLFVDAHLEWLTAAEAKSILQQAAAGIRPIRYPPTTAPATQRSD